MKAIWDDQDLDPELYGPPGADGLQLGWRREVPQHGERGVGFRRGDPFGAFGASGRGFKKRGFLLGP